MFLVKNGEKQRDVLSSILFCLYLDGILAIFAESNVGCFIGTWYFGALAYADDIVFLALSAREMRLMLNICDEYAERFDNVFNAKKSKCIFISSRRNASGCCPHAGLLYWWHPNGVCKSMATFGTFHY